MIGAIARKADKFVSSVQATLQGMKDVAGQVELRDGGGQGWRHQRAPLGFGAERGNVFGRGSDREVTVSIGEVVNHAQTTRATADQAGQTTASGATITENASRTIRSLSTTVRTAAEQVESLGQRSGRSVASPA